MPLPDHSEEKVPLIEPMTSSRRAQLLERMREACRDLRQQLRRGRPPAEYAALKKLLTAAEAAESILGEQGG
jgi:hypothetical protein